MLLLILVIIQPAYGMTNSCNCVAFRLDDVQDYWVDNAQIAVMHVFDKKHASLTIGIIGNIFGDDSKLIQYIKNNTKNKESPIEIANHGWNHENFTDFNKNQQSFLMEKTNKKLSKIFGIKPIIFIPPFDSLNNHTILAMKENNIRFVSSDVDQDDPTFLIKGNNVYHIPGNAKTANLVDNDTIWQHYDHKHIFVDVMSSIQKYGYAVVVMHPQEYSVKYHSYYSNKVDKNQIRELELLIDDIKNSGVKILPLKQIPFGMNKKSNQDWLKNIFEWYEQGKISDRQVFSNINYLLDKKIISFNSKFK